MNTTKTLMLAAVTALSLGVGTATAQESAGGAGAIYEYQQFLAMQPAGAPQGAAASAAPASNLAPQYGSSDRTNTSNWPVPVLERADGGGN